MTGKKFDLGSTLPGSSVLDELTGGPAASMPASRPARAAPAPPSPPQPAPVRPVAPESADGAMESVLQARDSARDEPGAWVPFTVRLPAALVRRLALRVAADKSALHLPTLAASHYLNVALDAIPARPARAAEWGRAWRARKGGRAAATSASGSRVHQDTASAMRDLAAWLPTLDLRVSVWEVEAESLARLLDSLGGDHQGSR